MVYQTDFQRRQMADALQAQARFCEELTSACFDEKRAEHDSGPPRVRFSCQQELLEPIKIWPVSVVVTAANRLA
jgi:hypothetical protein